MDSHAACVHGTSTDAKEELPWQLPPGFRFHPTDDELVTFYLANKIQNPNFSDQAISDADLNKSEPWELPGKAKMGEKEWYFFSLKDRKYPTGVRTNRATHTGYWKATGKDREVMSSQKGLKGKIVVGMKKTLVFYTGRAPKGTKSNWVMHEYRVEEPLTGALKLRSSKDEWVLCRVFHKSAGGKKMTLSELQLSSDATNIIEARMIGTMAATSLPPLTELPWKNSQVYYTTSNSLHATSPPVFGQTQPVTGSASHHQVANLLSSLPAVATSCTLAAPSGNAIFTALFQHYDSSTQQQQSRRKPETEVQDYGQVYVQHNLHVPVSTSLGDPLNVNTTQSPAFAAPDAASDSCASAIDLAPVPLSDGHPYIPRFPSDLESFWLKSDHFT